MSQVLVFRELHDQVAAEDRRRVAERVPDAGADGGEEVLARLPRLHLGGDAQEVLDGRAIKARASGVSI